MGSENKRIEQLKKDLDKLHNKVVKAKKFTKKKDWKEFRASINKGKDNENSKYFRNLR